ncbi:MAG: ferrous iron transport protein A [Desulfonatronovibrio sp.]
MFKGFGRRRKREKGCQVCGSGNNVQVDNGQASVLTNMGKGCKCRVRRHLAGGAIRQRLLDLGFIPDAEVEMIRCATLGDPLEMRLGTYYVTLRKKEADLIEVD